MSNKTKAQLEQEIVKITEEKELLLKQIKNLKKRKNPQPVVDNTWKGLQAALKEELETAKECIVDQNITIADKEAKIDAIKAYHKRKIDSFLKNTWFQRLFLSKKDIENLL